MFINMTIRGTYHDPDALLAPFDPYGRGNAGPPGQTFGVGALARVVQLAIEGASEAELSEARDAAYRDGWTYAEIDHAIFEGKLRAQRDATDALVKRIEAMIDSLYGPRR